MHSQYLIALPALATMALAQDVATDFTVWDGLTQCTGSVKATLHLTPSAGCQHFGEGVYEFQFGDGAPNYVISLFETAGCQGQNVSIAEQTSIVGTCQNVQKVFQTRAGVEDVKELGGVRVENIR